MLKEQTVFKFHAVRCKRNGVAGRRKRKRFEIAIDQNENRIGGRNGNLLRLRHGIRKCLQRIAGCHRSTSVTNLEINGFIILYGKNLYGRSKFIQFLELNGSANQNLHVFSFKSHIGKMADHGLMVICNFRAGNVKLRIINSIKMFRKISCGKFRNAGSADMGMHSRACACAQGHDGNFSVCVTAANILIIRKIIFLRIFTILRDFPSSIHFYYLFPKQKF